MEIQWTIGLELQLMNQNNKIIPPELISLYFLYGFFSVLELGWFFFFDFISKDQYIIRYLMIQNNLDMHYIETCIINS